MTQGDGPGRMRASDDEREQVATILRAAVTEGRLNLEEGDERLAKLYASRFRDELGPLTQDLPDGGRRALLDTPEMAAIFRHRLRVHSAGTLALAGLLVGAWVLSGAHFFWPLIPLLFLTFGLMRHWRHRHAPWGRGPWGRGMANSGGPAGSGWDGGDWRGGPPWGRRGW